MSALSPLPPLTTSLPCGGVGDSHLPTMQAFLLWWSTPLWISVSSRRSENRLYEHGSLVSQLCRALSLGAMWPCSSYWRWTCWNKTVLRQVHVSSNCTNMFCVVSAKRFVVFRVMWSASDLLTARMYHLWQRFTGFTMYSQIPTNIVTTYPETVYDPSSGFEQQFANTSYDTAQVRLIA